MKLLHIDSSALAANSVSRTLTAAIVAGWQEKTPGLEVTYRDLDSQPLPHLTHAVLTEDLVSAVRIIDVTGVDTVPLMGTSLSRMDAVRSEALNLQARLQALDVVIPMHVGDNDKLYGSVTTTIIGDTLAALGVDVDRRRILMDAPIRTLGEHPIRVRLHASVIALVPVKVVSDHQPIVEDEPTPAAPAEEA